MDEFGSTMRANPMVWQNEEQATGVFIGTAPDGLSLVGMPESTRFRRRERIDPNAVASPALKRTIEAIESTLIEASNSGGSAPRRFDLRDLDDADRALLWDVLGEGDVSIVAGIDPIYQVNEANLTGVWRIRASDARGELVSESVEVGDVPSIVREAGRVFARGMPPRPDMPPPGVMNAVAILNEIEDRARQWRPGVETHVLNFTLLPMTPEDAAFLTTTLGQIPLTIVSGGYGTSRIVGTAVPHAWGVQYLNSSGVVILDTVEVGDVPGAARAACEDFEDSAVRLREIMEAYL